MKALAFAAAVSLTISFAALAQDSKPTVKPNGASKQPAEAAANIDVAAIQKKIDEFTEAIKREPRNDAFYGARGDGYQRLGKLDLSIKDLSRAIELNPRRQSYFIVRANVYGKQKLYKESYVDYSRALECGPKTHNLYLRQGQAAALAHEYKLALSSARQALSLMKDDLETLVLLGGAEQMNGLYQDSLNHLTRAIDKNPFDSGAFEIRANTYLKLGKPELAKADFDRAKALLNRP